MGSTVGASVGLPVKVGTAVGGGTVGNAVGAGSDGAPVLGVDVGATPGACVVGITLGTAVCVYVGITDGVFKPVDGASVG